MVLEVEALRIALVAGDLVDALAELGVVAVGEKSDDDAAVAGVPRLAAVVRSIDTSRRDGDQQAVGVVGVDEDRVQAHPAAAGLPLRAMRVVPQTRDEREAAPAVVAAEQGRRFDAGVHHVGLVGWSGASCQILANGASADSGNRNAASFVLGPCRAEIVEAA